MFLIRLHHNADPAQQQQILIFKKNPYFAGPAQSVSSAFYQFQFTYLYFGFSMGFFLHLHIRVFFRHQGSDKGKARVPGV